MKRKGEGDKEEVVLLSVEVMVNIYIYIEQEERWRVIKCGEEKTNEKSCPWKTSD